MIRNRQGQSTVEYALLVGIIVAAALAMQVYVKRGTMGKMRDAADQIGEQYDPYTTTHTYNTNYVSARGEKTATTGKMDTTLTNEERTKSGTEDTTAITNQSLF